jgi:hypothetical protein
MAAADLHFRHCERSECRQSCHEGACFRRDTIYRVLPNTTNIFAKILISSVSDDNKGEGRAECVCGCSLADDADDNHDNPSLAKKSPFVVVVFVAVNAETAKNCGLQLPHLPQFVQYNREFLLFPIFNFFNDTRENHGHNRVRGNKKTAPGNRELPRNRFSFDLHLGFFKCPSCRPGHLYLLQIQGGIRQGRTPMLTQTLPTPDQGYVAAARIVVC